MRKNTTAVQSRTCLLRPSNGIRYHPRPTSSYSGIPRRVWWQWWRQLRRGRGSQCQRDFLFSPTITHLCSSISCDSSRRSMGRCHSQPLQTHPSCCYHYNKCYSSRTSNGVVFGCHDIIGRVDQKVSNILHGAFPNPLGWFG